MQHFGNVDDYLDATDRWHDEIVAIRPLLLHCGLVETIKWGKPCYCHDDDNVVMLQELADHLAVMLFKGVLLDDPADILDEQGPNTHGPRRIRITSTTQVAALSDTITAYVREAIVHEQAGTPLPVRDEEEFADELVERLASDVEFADAFERLTPGRQREYNLHVSSALQASTRERRVDQIAPRVLCGKGLRDR